MNIDPAEVGRQLGDLVHDAIAPLARRIAELELLVKGVDAAQVDRIAKSILNGEDIDG